MSAHRQFVLPSVSAVIIDDTEHLKTMGRRACSPEVDAVGGNFGSANSVVNGVPAFISYEFLARRSWRCEGGK